MGHAPLRRLQQLRAGAERESGDPVDIYVQDVHRAWQLIYSITLLQEKYRKSAYIRKALIS